MTNKYAEFLAMVSTEFHRYVMENQEFTDKIPANDYTHIGISCYTESRFSSVDLAQTIKGADWILITTLLKMLLLAGRISKYRDGFLKRNIYLSWPQWDVRFNAVFVRLLN